MWEEKGPAVTRFEMRGADHTESSLNGVGERGKTKEGQGSETEKGQPEVWNSVYRGVSRKSPNTALPLCSLGCSNHLLSPCCKGNKRAKFTPHLSLGVTNESTHEVNFKNQGY